MSPRLRSRFPARRATPRTTRSAVVIAVLALVTAVLAAACQPAFDPTGPCTADGSAAGAYPELEAVVPTTYNGAKPDQLDSGRTCTADGLGSLATHGVKEMRFAGGTWKTGTDSGLSLAIFIDPSGPALDPAWVAEFYETGARAGKDVDSVDTSEYAVTPTITGHRIDVLNGESYQSVVVWGRNGQVAIALVADFIREIQTKDAHDKVVRAAVDAFGG